LVELLFFSRVAWLRLFLASGRIVGHKLVKPVGQAAGLSPSIDKSKGSVLQAFPDANKTSPQSQEPPRAPQEPPRADEAN
jgi:hypothetical protein